MTVVGTLSYEQVMPHSLLNSLLGLLFPERCVGCRCAGALFCATCQSSLEPYARHDLLPCGLDSMCIGYVFDGALRTAIHQLKYRKRRRVAQPLGALLVARIAQRLPNGATVLPVPLHAERLAERGFNQAEALAEEVARCTGLPLLPNGLVRVRATAQQARLSAPDRQENVRAAFMWQGTAAPPARVLLVDDVATTGATLSACAAALRDAGTSEVHGVALARSR